MLLVSQGLHLNVYIKSFNRPFYLDRCIRSVNFLVAGVSKVIVLDDGTLSRYMKKIVAMHPHVEVRSSGADDGKYELLRQEQFKAIRNLYPIASDFWLEEIEKEKASYFFMMEDDAWMSRRLDLGLIGDRLEALEGVIYKCWWGDDLTHAHNVYRAFRARNGQTFDCFRPAVDHIRNLYSAWVVAFAVFRRDYWLHNFSGLRRMADEQTQLCNVHDFMMRNPAAGFSKSRERCVYQGWAVPGRSTPEYYDKGLRQHLYMDALNEAWYEGRLDVTENYPYDFSDSYLVSLLAKELSSGQVEIWKQWKASEVKYYYS